MKNKVGDDLPRLAAVKRTEINLDIEHSMFFVEPASHIFSTGRAPNPDDKIGFMTANIKAELTMELVL